MMPTYLDFCVQRPGPAFKQGYPGIPSRSLNQIEGEVKHDAGGPKSAMYGVLDNPNRLASWTFSIFKAGPPDQHYPLEAVAWINGGPNPNIRFVGMEHEGIPGEPLNPNQVFWTTKISAAIRALCPAVAANPPTRQVNLWEHNEMTQFGSDPTACPSGRIPWPVIIAGLTQEEVIEMFLARSVDVGNVYIVGTEGKRWIDDETELMVYQRQLGPWKDYTQGELDRLPDVVDWSRKVPNKWAGTGTITLAHKLEQVNDLLCDKIAAAGPPGTQKARMQLLTDTLTDTWNILFNDWTNDAVTDKRRLIGIGQKVKTLSSIDVNALATAIVNQLPPSTLTEADVKDAVKAALQEGTA